VGTLNPRKNVHSLIEAAASRPDLTLTIAGEGVREAKLRSLAEELGVASRVEFIGHFPPGEHLRRMRKLFRKAEVFCLPSTAESFGLVMTEALACGTPVAGFGPILAEIEPLLGTDCGASIWTGTPEEIGEAIDRVLERDWSRRRLRRAVLRAFHPRVAARRYVELMQSTVAERSHEPIHA
jgi:glycosyltransferase involved in cell wall biosynthesis